MQVIVNGLLTTYQRLGSGRQLLILHGWGDNSAGWLPFARALSADYEVIVPDLPGFGGTQTPAEAWGLNDYAEFVAAFIKKLRLQPAILLGHSNGGAIAIRGLATKTLYSEKLVLLASAGIRGEYKGRNKALRLATKTGKLLAAPLPPATKRRLRQKVYDSVGSDMLVAEHLQATFKRIVADDVRVEAASLDLPTLLVYGEADTQTPIQYGELLHQQIDGSTLEIVGGADHFLHLTQSAKVEQLVKDFLA